jgi:hypothetical protein
VTADLKNCQLLTAPLHDGGGSENINSCTFNKHCAFRQVSASNPPQRKAANRWQTFSFVKMTYRIPNQNNLYGTIFDIESKKILADMFEANGWSIRKSTWTDFEIRTDWGEIVIENEDQNPFINGAIDPTMFDNFRLLLDFLKIKYSIEFYDDQGTLIKEGKNEN